MDLKTLGVAVASKIEHLFAPAVGRREMAQLIGYIENAGAPSAVVPDFIGQKLFDTTNRNHYVAYGVAAGEWAPAGASDVPLNGNTLAVEAGAGITGGTGTVYASSVEQVGGIIKTRILLDLTGLSSSTTDLDIIGQGAVAAHLGQITADRNGTILSGRITCLEAPVGGVTDIDMYSATEATGVFDGGVAALTETALHTHGAAWTIGVVGVLTALPAAGEYLYLTGGAAGTAAAYTAGKFLIELEGY